MLRVYFEAQGYRVIPAYTGQDALEKCRSEQPDLILLDVRLPDMDGFQIGQHLQEDVRTSRLPVIFVTERRARDDRIAGLKLGAIDYDNDHESGIPGTEASKVGEIPICLLPAENCLLSAPCPASAGSCSPFPSPSTRYDATRSRAAGCFFPKATGHLKRESCRRT